jgi:hypothetical protein
MASPEVFEHEEEMRHGREARTDWNSYHSAFEAPDATYHNRPDCVYGAAIDEDSLRAGTADRPLCDACRNAEHPAK